MSTWTFKSAKSARWHSGALLYALTAYGAGWWLLFQGGGLGFGPGTRQAQFERTRAWVEDEALARVAAEAELQLLIM